MGVKVSVIVPVFNCEKYVEKCLSSILDQTYPNLEVLVNDDGSTDSSYSICYSIAQQDSRVNVFHQDNSGQSVARNAMLGKVSGDYVMFVDSDDLIAPGMISRLVEMLEANDADCASCRLMKVYEQKIPSQIRHSDNVKAYDARRYVKKMISSSAFGCYPVGRLFKAEYLEYLHFPEGMIFEDLSAMPQLMIHMNKIVGSDEPLYFYYQSEESTLRKGFAKKRTDALRAYVNLWHMAYDMAEFSIARVVMRSYLYKYYCYKRDVRINGLDVEAYESIFGPYKTWFWKQLVANRFIEDLNLISNRIEQWR